MRWLFYLFVAGILGGVYCWDDERPVSRPPGVLAAQEPLQRDLDPTTRFDDRGFVFTERAPYDITARVLRKEIYRADGAASLAPVDLAVGWGPVSDTASIDRIEFSQTIDGYLVDVSGARGVQWSTSRIRSDTGDSACEIVWVETLDVR